MLVILIDETTKECLPYIKVKKIHDKHNTYYTNCLVFFDFQYLEQFGDIVVRSGDKYISARELLDNTGEYTEKNIKRIHNILKLFITGSFEWKRGRNKC